MLTEDQKIGNRVLGRRRIVAEHGIGECKIWRAGSECFRNPTKRKTMYFKNMAGLHNLMFG